MFLHADVLDGLEYVGGERINEQALGGLGITLTDLARLYAGIARAGEMPNLVEFYKKEINLNFVFWIAKRLLRDPEDLVQKGYGWMLKVASNTKQKEVLDFVMKNKKTMPRTALRYAIEKMPRDLKIKAMKND